MRLAGATTIDQANRVLRDFLPRFNSQFGVSPAQPGSTYRQLQDGVCFDAVLCFKYLRTVARDNTVQFDGATVQLMPDGYRASYTCATVEVQERLDGSGGVVHQGRALAAESAPPGPIEIRARSGRRPNGHPPPDGADRSSNGAHSHPVGSSLRSVAQSLRGGEPLPSTKTNTGSPRRPAPDHPWRRRLLT